MIDFSKFDTEITFIAPVFQGHCQYNRKKYTIDARDDWYKITARGNNVTNYEPAIIEMEDFSQKNIIKGYTYNNNIVFQNFDVAKRKAGKYVMSTLQFNRSETFSSIEAILWEDKNIYYYRPNYTDILIYEIKNAFESNEEISTIKGITPELKTLYLFHDIERQQLQELQRKIEEEQLKKEREEELEQYKQTLQGKLVTTFTRAGAQIIRYSINNRNNTIVVDWKLINTGTEFNSVIELETFHVVEAGYCMTGQDNLHSAQSMVVLAQDYDEQGLIYKTRY